MADIAPFRHDDVHPGTNEVARVVVDAAIAVHRELGPGLLESTYRRCLARELKLRGHRIASELPIPVTYKGETLDVGFRVDLVVDESVLVELKAVEALHRVHFAQLTTYLKLTGLEVGFLMNFDELRLVDGLHRIVGSSSLCELRGLGVDLPAPEREIS